MASIDWSQRASAISTVRRSARWLAAGTDASLVALLLLSPLSVRAQAPAYRVRDIGTLPATSGPQDFVHSDGKLFFFGDSVDGFSLWRSDGSPDGTVPVGTISLSRFPPVGLTGVNGSVFFVNFGSLWTSDGDQISPLSTPFVRELVAVNDTLFFTTIDVLSNPEQNQLWRSDGTAGGTVRVADVVADQMTNLNGTLLFVGYDEAGGRELWRSAGTEVGTQRVKDINPSGDGFPFDFRIGNYAALYAVNGALYFFADDGSGLDLWRSDGTEAGTQPLKQLNVDVAEVPEAGQANGLLFFLVGNTLWRSDGTEAGTFALTDLAPDSQLSASFIDLHGSLLLFVEGDLFSTDTALWRSDGTPQGTARVTSFPAPSNYLVGAPADNGDPTLLFTLGRNTGHELWRTDGTAAGTERITQLSGETDLVSSLRDAWFFSNEGELWRSDGTTAGTMLFKDLNDPVNSGSFPSDLVDAAGTLFFTARSFTNIELWRSDGTEAGTAALAGTDAVMSFSDLTDVGGTLFFDTVVDTGWQLWKSDGTRAGTVVVKDFTASPDPEQGSVIAELTALKRALFFARSDDLSTDEIETGLWRSDGTAAGTVPVKTKVDVSELTPVNGTLFFRGRATSGREELWKSDGTTSGTRVVKDINPGSDSGGPYLIAALGGEATFFVNDPLGGTELWKSDGSEGGTVRIKGIVPRGDQAVIDASLVVQQLLFFSLRPSSGADPTDLWVSDGTDTGTRRIARSRYLGSPHLDKMVAVNDTLFFVANDGQELRKSDGTEAGTVRVARIAGSRGIQGLTDIRGTLVFWADGAFWRSDGTESGTTRITGGLIDLGQFTPLSPVVSGARLFFAPYEPVAGVELWALPLAALGCGNGVRDPGEACDEGGATTTCDADCTVAECGDGTVNAAADEACDFADPLDGNCCTENCTLEPSGTVCSTQSVCDGPEACDAAGRCQPGMLLDCSDGNAHTTDSCDGVRGCSSIASCGGDCNADGVVRVNELVTLVGVALEQAPLSGCVAGDTDRNGTIVVNELVAAVNHGLSECPAPTDQ